MQETPNLNYIKQLSGDDTAFEDQFISILKDEFPEEVQTYTGHIESQKPNMAGDVVHKLKHKFNILSMYEAYDFAVTYEEELREGQMEQDADFRNILKTITNYLNTL